jgi:hypothetical protein
VRARAVLVELRDSYSPVVTSVSERLEYLISISNFFLHLGSKEAPVVALHDFRFIIVLILEQKISDLLIVYFDHTHADVVLDLTFLLFHNPVNFVDGIEVEARIQVISDHRKCFSGSSLSVR